MRFLLPSLFVVLVGAYSTSGAVVVHRLDADVLTPDIKTHAGTVHMVYGTSSKDAFYRQSTDGGENWSVPLQLNTRGTCDSALNDVCGSSRGAGDTCTSCLSMATFTHATIIRAAGCNGGDLTAFCRPTSEPAGKVTTTMGERGPKLAVAADGTHLHVVWMDLWYPGALTYVRAVHSEDGGRTWSAPVAASDTHGIDGSTVAVDGTGTVIVLWHDLSHTTSDGQPVAKPANSSEATWMYFVRSDDHGASFSFPSQRVQIVGGMPAATCSMCMMDAVRSVNGAISVVFRSGLNNIRDFYELTASPPYTTNAWTPQRINEDQQYQTTCPMNGPTITQAVDNGALRVAAFTTGATQPGQGFDTFAYWSTADAGGPWGMHVPTPNHERNERYPTAIVSGSGDDAVVLFVWQVGPMAVSGIAQVKYALFHAVNGTAIRSPGKGSVVELGTAFAGTKATVWVGINGTFHIATTAK